MQIKKETDTLVIQFEENITAQIVKELKDEVKEKLNQETGYGDVVADLSEVKYIDSTGITLIIGIYKSLTTSDKKFSVVGARDEIKNLFSVIRLDRIFNIQ